MMLDRFDAPEERGKEMATSWSTASGVC